MLLLIGFPDLVMTSMIANPIMIACTSQKALLFCYKIRHSKRRLFILLLINFLSRLTISLTVEEVSRTFLTSTIHGKMHKISP